MLAKNGSQRAFHHRRATLQNRALRRGHTRAQVAVTLLLQEEIDRGSAHGEHSGEDVTLQVIQVAAATNRLPHECGEARSQFRQRIGLAKTERRCKDHYHGLHANGIFCYPQHDTEAVFCLAQFTQYPKRSCGNPVTPVSTPCLLRSARSYHFGRNRAKAAPPGREKSNCKHYGWRQFERWQSDWGDLWVKQHLAAAWFRGVLFEKDAATGDMKMAWSASKQRCGREREDR